MPRVTGLELIKKLRSEDMTLSVILASGTALTEELDRYPWLQLDAVLPKPFSIEELYYLAFNLTLTIQSKPVRDWIWAGEDSSWQRRCSKAFSTASIES